MPNKSVVPAELWWLYAWLPALKRRAIFNAPDAAKTCAEFREQLN
jgi:hypothetical protein